MRRAARRAAWILAALVAVTLVTAGGLLITANTVGGRSLIERWTARLTEGHVRISGLAGSFPSAVDAEELVLSDDRGAWLTAQGISLRWSPLDLIAWDLRATSLHVARLDIVRPPVTAHHSPSSGGSVKLPHIDVEQFSVETLVLEPALVGTRTSLVVRGGAHLKSLEDATGSLTAHRTDGDGDYELALHFDRTRMDATLRLEEPASGPLEHLVQLPGLGALSVTASLEGPRTAERIELRGRVGNLSASAQGTVDLERRSAELDYSLDSAAIAPRPGLAWRSVSLRGSWHGPLTRPQASAHLLIDGLEIPGHVGFAMLDASLGAAGGALTLSATTSGLVLPGPAPRLLAGSPIRLDATLHLDEPTRPIEIAASQRLLSVQARAVTAGERSATFEVRIPDVAPFAALAGDKSTAPAGLKQVSGSLSASGKLVEIAAGARLDLDARTAGLRAPPALASLLGKSPRLQLSGSWTDRALEVERLVLTGASLSFSGDGSAELAAGGTPSASGSQSGPQSLRARWNLSVPDLAAVSPAMRGTFKLSGELSGPIGALSAQIQESSTVSIRGSPQGALDASLQVRGLPSALTGSLQAQGSFDGAPLDLQASLERGRDSLFHLLVQHADWKSVHVAANVATGADLSQGRGSLNLNIGRLADLQPLIGRPLEGSVEGSVTLSPDAGHTHAQLRVEARNVGDSGVVANAVLTGSGPISALPLQLAVQSPDVRGSPATFDAAVRLSFASRMLTLEKVEAGYRGASLHLLSPARIAFRDGLRLSGLRLGMQHATLSADGEVSPALDLSASVSRVDAALVNSFAPDLLAQGTLSAEARLTGTLSAPKGRATLEVSGLRMANSTARNLPALNLKCTAQLGGTAAQVDAQLTAGRASQLKLTGRAPLTAAGTLSLELSGKLDAAMANPLLEAHGERAAGTLTVAATVTGPARAPEIGGSIELTHGDIRDYAQGVHFDDITARLTGGQGILRIASLTAHAGPGQISMTGTLGVLKSKMPIDVELTAKNAQPITSDILTANLNADIHVKGTLRQRIDVTGTVHLNRAQIGIPNSLPPNVAVLDVRRPGDEPPEAEKRRLTIGLDVSLAAPREILVQGRGLDAELGGSLTIHGTSKEPQVRGGFQLIMGTFTLSSTQLNFTMGEVSFNGAGLRGKIDPTLDFTAQATAADATVTLRVTGFADAPKFTLTSTPQLPQDEILARLLFGESASQLTGLQVAEIGAALASLSGIGGSGLNPLEKVQKALGLNRLTVGSATTTSANGTPQTAGASLTAGRYVSSRVFVAATQNTTGTSQLEVDISLSKHLKLQTKLGNGSATAQGTTPENDPGSSIGLSYQFEY